MALGLQKLFRLTSFIGLASANAINIDNFRNFKLKSLNFFNLFLILLYKKKNFITINKDFFYHNIHLFYKKIKNII